MEKQGGLAPTDRQGQDSSWGSVGQKTGIVGAVSRVALIANLTAFIGACAHSPQVAALGRPLDGKPLVPIATDAQGLIPAMGWCEEEKQWRQIAVDTKGRVILSPNQEER